MKKIIYNSMVVLQNLQECISVTLWLSIIPTLYKDLQCTDYENNQ